MLDMGIAKNAGRHTRRYRRLKADLRQLRLPCYLCGQSIDYEAKAPHPDSFTVEHVKPRVSHMELAEDPGNLRAAHFNCNNSKGTGDADSGLGFTSRDW